jgi:hypothetical protein
LPDNPQRGAQSVATSPVWMSLIGGPGDPGHPAMHDGDESDSKDGAPRLRSPTKHPRARRARVASAPTKPPTPPDAHGAQAADGERASATAAPMAAGGTPSEGEPTSTTGSLGAGSGGLGGIVRGPGLLPVPSPCRRYFPVSAKANHGEVQIDVHVDPSGRARFRRLLAETPRGQGFGSAAAACAQALRFAPARNGAGMAIAGSAKLELRFDRS